MDIALFSPSSLFHDEEVSVDEEKTRSHQSYEARRHQFPGMELLIREFSFHQLNANLLWPGTFAFAEWLVQHQSWIEGRHCLELGSIVLGGLFIISGSGILSSAYYQWLNSWGETFPTADPDWDLIIASDILLYVKQYPNLIKSLAYLLKSYKPKDDKAVSPVGNDQSSGMCMGLPAPAFLMSWRRRIGKEDESLFFAGCENAGLEVKHIGSRMHCIKPRENIVTTPNRVDD
ncbi:hypothetical protein CRYUN_Cryun05aG0270200 [Craigia yunnanensis]